MTVRPSSPALAASAASHRLLTVGTSLVLAALITAGATGCSSRVTDDTAAPAASAEAGAEASAASEEAASADTAPGIGAAVTSGDLEFTVTGVEEIGTEVGNEYLNETAQGRYFAVALKVTNVGSKAATFFSDNVQLVDAADRTFESDSTATLYAAPDSSAWLSEINPGNSFEGRVVFDLPADATPAAVIVKENMFSGGGERIRLQ